MNCDISTSQICSAGKLQPTRQSSYYTSAVFLRANTRNKHVGPTQATCDKQDNNQSAAFLMLNTIMVLTIQVNKASQCNLLLYA